MSVAHIKKKAKYFLKNKKTKKLKELKKEKE